MMKNSIYLMLFLCAFTNCKKENGIQNEAQTKKHLIGTNFPIEFLYFDMDGNKKLLYNEKNLLSEVIYDDWYIIKLGYDESDHLKNEFFYNANLNKCDTVTYILNNSGQAIYRRINSVEYDSLVYDDQKNIIKLTNYCYPSDRNTGGYRQIITYLYDDNHNSIDERYFNKMPHLPNFDVLYPWDFVFRFTYEYDDKPNPFSLIDKLGNNKIHTACKTGLCSSWIIYEYDNDGFPLIATQTDSSYNSQLNRYEMNTKDFCFMYD